jgi:hypothetical protein
MRSGFLETLNKFTLPLFQKKAVAVRSEERRVGKEC